MRKLSGGEELARWAGSALSEGLEEPAQSLVSGSVAKGVYAPEKEFYSSTDENAVAHPGRMLWEAGYGMAVGGILSGGEVAGDILQRIDLSRVATNDARKVKDLSVASSLQIKTSIHNSFQKKNEYQYLSVGKASSQLVADMQTVGVNIAGYDHAIRDNDLRHIRRSHGDLSNDKYKVSEADLEKIPEIIENYDVLYLGYRTKDGNQAIAYEKTIAPKSLLCRRSSGRWCVGYQANAGNWHKQQAWFFEKVTKGNQCKPRYRCAARSEINRRDGMVFDWGSVCAAIG